MGRSQREIALDPYGDGLDADGYSLPNGGWKPYKRGCEEDAGDFRITGIGEGAARLFARIQCYREIGDSTESPIEDLMGAALLIFFERAGARLTLAKNIDRDNPVDGLLLVPQFKWSHYRSDWAIYNQRTGGAFLIECDGKDYHSSPEQRAHDAKKDAAAHDRGYLTVRFPGWRINKDPDSLAQKVYDAVMGGGE